MAGPIEAVHDALIARLKAMNTAAGGRVFGQIQHTKPLYPYIMAWQGNAVPIDEDCSDRTEIACQVDAWADTERYFSVKTIADAIRSDLHEAENFEVAGYRVDRIRIESITFPDAAPNHRALIIISIEVQPA